MCTNCSILLAVKRPPKHISEHILKGKSSSHQVKPTSRTAGEATLSTVTHSDSEGGEERVGEGMVGEAEKEWDAISLHGVKGERNLHGDNSELFYISIHIVCSHIYSYGRCSNWWTLIATAVLQ